MFQSISWQEFISVLALLFIGYYFVTGLLLYSSEISSIFNQRSREFIDSKFKQEQAISKATNDLLGRQKNDIKNSSDAPRAVVVPADELVVSELNLNEEQNEPLTLLNSITDDVTNLTSEIEALIRIVAHGKKEECSPLLQTLLSRYPNLIGTPYEEQITLVIYETCNERCSFHFELNEIKSWWPDPRKQVY